MASSYDLSPAAAAAYDDRKVPAIFAPIAEASLEQVDLTGVRDILDVACGSGIVARALIARAHDAQRIVGADLSSAMIDVARARVHAGQAALSWIVAPADAMPVDAGSFDLVTCQQGLQFFPDKPAALAEMRRVLRPGGRLMLTCWAGTPPLFATIARHLEARVSVAAATTAVAPFSFSDAEHIASLITAAGFAPPEVARLDVDRRLPGVRAGIETELLASPNEAVLRDLSVADFDGLVDAILADLSGFRAGSDLVLPQSTWLFVARAAG